VFFFFFFKKKGFLFSKRKQKFSIHYQNDNEIQNQEKGRRR